MRFFAYFAETWGSTVAVGVAVGLLLPTSIPVRVAAALGLVALGFSVALIYFWVPPFRDRVISKWDSRRRLLPRIPDIGALDLDKAVVGMFVTGERAGRYVWIAVDDSRDPASTFIVPVRGPVGVAGGLLPLPDRPFPGPPADTFVAGLEDLGIRLLPQGGFSDAVWSTCFFWVDSLDDRGRRISE